MGFNISKTRLGWFITYNKSVTRKILFLLVVLFLVITLFSTKTFASEVKDIEGDDDKIVEVKDASPISKFSDTLRDFISQRLENPKWLPSFRLVTRYQKNESSSIIERSTRMRLVLPTSIDVNGDHIKDIRVWISRRPALDLRPPALCIKTTFLIRRLPGMESIKDDFFEIYLEYNPKIITKFFYLTKDIDRVRVGYQSPAGEEVPKTCILTDKIVPYLIYPMKKTMHKISVNPCSIVGKEQLNLLFALADLENETVKSELIMQVNYTPAIRVGEIIFEREKTKLFGRGQSLGITRMGGRPSNVTLFIKELMWRNLTIVKQGGITVENMPRKINLEWFLGRTGYIGIDTHNEEVGRVRAVFNNTIFVGFVPENSMHGRVAWEDRTLIGVLVPEERFELGSLETFNLSFSVYDSFVLKDFSLMATNQENMSFQYLLEVTASSLLLDIEGGANFGNVTAEYWLLPISSSDDTTISIDIKNLTLKAENFAVNIEASGNLTEEVLFSSDHDTYVSETGTSKKSVIDSPTVIKSSSLIRGADNKANNTDTERKLYINISSERFEVSSKESSIFLTSKLALNATNEAEGELDLHIKNGAFSITEIVTTYGDSRKNTFSTVNGSFSSLDFSTSGVFSGYEFYTSPYGGLSWSQITGLSIVVNGSFELNNFSFWGDNFLNITAFKCSGNLSYTEHFISYGRGFYIENETSDSNFEGKGTVTIQNIHFENGQNNILMIGEFSLSLEGTYSKHHYGNSSMSTTTNCLKGNGNLVINSLYARDRWNNTLEWDLLQLTGKDISIYTMSIYGNLSLDFPSYSELTLVGNGTAEISKFTIKSPDNDTIEIGEIYLSLNGTYSEKQIGNFTTYSINSCSKGNVTASLTNLYYHDKWNNNITWSLLKLSGKDISIYTNISSDPLSYTEIRSIGNGTVEIKNITIESSYDVTQIDEISLSLEGTFSEQQIGNFTTYSINSCSKGNVTASLTNLYYHNKWNNNTGRCDLFYLSGEISISTNISSDPPSYTEIRSIGIGTVEIRNLNILSPDYFLQIDLIRLSGDFTFTSLPLQDNPSYGGIRFDGDATFEIQNVESSVPAANIFDSVYLNVSGDFTLEAWTDTDSLDYHILWDSQNGFTIEQFSIELDSGIIFEIERKGTLEGSIGPGYVHFGRYKGDDGFVFIDSSEINFDDVIFTFKSSIVNKGIRFSPSNRYFDANVFLLQWDSMTLDLPHLRAIPYNWYKTGSISTGFNIQLIDGNNIYDFWPLENSGNSDEEMENTEENIIYNGGYGIEPLGNILPPNKPHKPKGPTGGVVFGRIVKGNSYTFTTTTDGNDQYIAYEWDWGDGTYSTWSPFIKSGIGVTGSHIWTELGTYNIRVKAKNINGEESGWSNPLTITVRKKLSDGNQGEMIEGNSMPSQQHNQQNSQNQSQNNQQSNPTNN